jgi:hypothetical protein
MLADTWLSANLALSAVVRDPSSSPISRSLHTQPHTPKEAITKIN